MTLSLASLLGIGDTERFLRDVWDQAPWLGRGTVDAPARDHLLTLASFERLLAGLARPNDGWLQLARQGRRELPGTMLCEDGLLKLEALYAAFRAGESLYLTKAERLAPSLMAACRDLELELGARGVALRQPVNAHVFLTPPGAQAFPTHRDEHASLVVQLDGAKAWRVFDRTTERPPAEAAPMRAGGVDASALGAEVRTYRLVAGDVLYVPPFWAHDALAQAEHSLHVTFRIFPMRWSDLVLALAARHPGLDGPLPRHALARPAELGAALGATLESDAFTTPLPRLLGRLAREHAVPRRVLPDDGLRQVLVEAALTLDTPVVRRAHATCHVYREGERVGLAFPGGSVLAPAVMEEVFRFIAAAPRLCARALPALASGAAYDRLDVIRALVADGLLRVDGAAAVASPEAA